MDGEQLYMLYLEVFGQISAPRFEELDAYSRAQWNRFARRARELAAADLRP